MPIFLVLDKTHLWQRIAIALEETKWKGGVLEY
jgi:hypothetical protein